MKFRGLMTVCLAGASLLGFAQTHVEGIEYYNADQFNNARELLNRNMNNSGTDKALSNFYLGQIALLEKNNAAARSYFEAGIAANPECGYNYVGLGEILLPTDPKAAQAQFKLAEKYSKKDAALEIAIARAYYNVDPVTYEKEITKRVEKAQKYDFNEPAIYIFEGDRSRDNKDWGNAAGQYEMAINFDPQTPAAYVKYANMYKLVNPQYTISKLRELLQQNPNSALGQRELANAYYQQEKYKEAAEAYGRYINNPNHFKSDEDRYALLLFSDGDYQKGYDYATSLLATNPGNFSAQRFQFMNAAQIKEMEPQLLALADALYANHIKNPSANKFASIDYTLIADEFSKAKRYDDAIAVLQEGMKELPEQKSFIRDLAMVYYDQNKTADALATLLQYASSVSNLGYNDANLIANIAYVNAFDLDGDAKAKVLDTASEYAAKAAELNPKAYRPVKRMGDVAALKAGGGDAGNAAKVPFYIQAAKIIDETATTPSASDAQDIYSVLGNYYKTQGDKAAAKAAYGKYLEAKPDDAAAKKIYDSL